MAGVKKSAVELYPFAKTSFEKLVVYCAANSARFWSVVGAELESDAFSEGPARDLIRVIKMFVGETGRPPGSTAIALQRMRRHMDDGLQTPEELSAAFDLLEDVDDGPKPEDDTVLAEVVAVVRKRLRQRVAYQAAEDYGKDRPFKETLALISRAESVGVVTNDIGLLLTEQSVTDALTHVGSLERMSTGIDELDLLLDGGVKRGDFGSFWGAGGSGKSTALYHMGVTCAKRGGLVAIATLENGPANITARCVANATGITIDSVCSNPKDAARIYRELGLLIRVKDFPARVSNFDSIARWVEALEQAHGRKVDMLVTDYADKLGVSPSMVKQTGQRADGSYNAMGLVYDQMFRYTFDRQIFHMTATQTRRREKGDKGLIGLDDGADSQEKARILDLVIGVNTNEERSEIVWNVPKHRNGVAGRKSSSVPADFARGRVSIVNDATIAPGMQPGMGAW